MDKPPALLKAEDVIGEKLRKNPDSPAWLQAKARADLLDGNYESAIKSLQRALEERPDSPELLTDLGSAYFLRAEATDRAIDYGNAIESLSKALAKSPEDPVALFNRALVCERMFLYTQAVGDWEHYLRVDPHGEWPDDARRRLDAIKEKMKQHQKSEAKPLLTPGELAEARSDDAALRDKVDERIEDYLDLAVADWLPKAFPTTQRGAANVFMFRSALRTLAETASQKHGDQWLSEALGQTPSAAWASGLRELSAAVQANVSGEADQAISHAQNADRRFRQAGCIAGILRARLEYLVGLNRRQEGHRCLASVLRGFRELHGHSYPWIQATMLLEASTCYGLAGNPGGATEYAHSASTFAHATRYGLLSLKGLYYDDGVTAPEVSSPEAWLRMRAGLSKFWDSGYPPILAFDFYSDLSFAGATSEMWRFAEAAGLETLLMASRTGDRAFEAASHHWLAQVAEMAGDLPQADAEFQRAGQVFKTLGDNQSSRSAEITTDVERAFLDVSRGELDAAAVRLHRAGNGLPEVANSHTYMLYHLSLGELHLRQGNAEMAERELSTAIAISEAGGDSFSPEMDRLIWHNETGRAYRGLLEVYSRIYHDDRKALAFLEWYRAAPLRVTSRNARIHALRFAVPEITWIAPQVAISRKLPEVLPGTAVLTWASFPSGLAIWVLDSHGLMSGWAGVPPSVLRTTINRFVRKCSDPSSDLSALNVDARQLYDWLVQPVASKLDPSLRLIVEPDDLLSQVPFPALMGPDGNYLGDRFVVVESPGIAYSRLLRSDTKISSRNRLLAVGNPLLLEGENGTRFPPLPEANLEARHVAANFLRPQVVAGEDATIENVSRGLPRAQVFHFAGHALSGGHQPGLLLASGKFESKGPILLGANQLRSNKLRQLRLVVLSGCQTAIADYGLEDSDSLVRVFLRAGVPQVVASKWRVDSHVSAEMMDHLYFELLNGKSAADALFDSAKQLRSNPTTSHPYYWSAFSVFGY